MGNKELVPGSSEWSFANEAAWRAARKARRNSAPLKLRAAAKLVGFVLMVSLALPAAASLGLLLGTGLAP